MNRRNPSPQLSARTELLPVQIPLSKIIPTQKVLRLTQAELASHVDNILNDNPFLEKIPESLSGIQQKEDGGGTVYTSWNVPGGGMDTDKNILEAVNADRGLSLTGDLLQQLEWLELPPADRSIAETIVSLADERGYVDPIEAEKIGREMGIEWKDLHRVWLQIKKNLEPPGVLCEDVQDSLATQLFRLGYKEEDLSVRVIRDYFPQFSKKKYAEIGKGLGVPPRQVRMVARVIHVLDPYPLRNRSIGEFDTSIIVPDVMVRYREGRLEVQINREMVPRIRLLKDVIKDVTKGPSFRIAHDEEKKKSKEYWIRKKEEAENLVNAIEYRESNLKKVIDVLIEKQRDFFIEGFAKLKPYRMIDLADELGIDKGTLSRLVNSKFVFTDWGTFRLREMFSLPVEVNGKKVSPKIIQEKIRALLEEFSEEKLTDLKLAGMLKKLGYPIARRTVNKYRKRLK